MTKGNITREIVEFDESGAPLLDDEKIIRCAWHSPAYREDILHLTFRSRIERG